MKLTDNPTSKACIDRFFEQVDTETVLNHDIVSAPLFVNSGHINETKYLFISSSGSLSPMSTEDNRLLSSIFNFIQFIIYRNPAIGRPTHQTDSERLNLIGELTDCVYYWFPHYDNEFALKQICDNLKAFADKHRHDANESVKFLLREIDSYLKHSTCPKTKIIDLRKKDL